MNTSALHQAARIVSTLRHNVQSVKLYVLDCPAYYLTLDDREYAINCEAETITLDASLFQTINENVAFPINKFLDVANAVSELPHIIIETTQDYQVVAYLDDSTVVKTYYDENSFPIWVREEAGRVVKASSNVRDLLWLQTSN